MQTAIIIVLIGIFIFFGHYLNGVFERRGIPDVLGLITIGVFLGPVLRLVDPASFGMFGPLFSNLVLIFILFESGTDLRFSEVRQSFRESAWVTLFGFLTTSITIFCFCFFLIKLPLLASAFIGTAMGGTSSAVVVGLVRKIAIQPKTATTLIIESAQTDVFTFAFPLTILGLMTTGQLSAGVAIGHLISSLIVALIMGIGGAFLWSLIISRVPALKSTKFSTPAFLFILYGITEYLNFSGPITALSFGIAIGNLHFLEPKFIERFAPNPSIVLPDVEKNFFGEIVFLLRIFFFVFIGINLRIDQPEWLAWGAFITLVLVVVRIIMVRYAISANAPVLDKAVVSVMIPKGLGAAVIATLPLYQGVLYGDIIQAICYAIILFSTLYCVVLFFLVRTNFSMPFYHLIYPSGSTSKAAATGTGS
jgi:NhaP-type Na+/H+ or K+/H+ antiporter